MTKHEIGYRAPAGDSLSRVRTARRAIFMPLPNGGGSILLLPEAQTMTARILADLLDCRIHTARTVLQRYGLHRASDQILRLRQYGWPIATRLVNDSLRRDRNILVAEYSLPGRFILDTDCSALWDFIRENRGPK